MEPLPSRKRREGQHDGVGERPSKRRRLSEASILCMRELFRTVVNDGDISEDKRILLQNAGVLLSQVDGKTWVSFPDTQGELQEPWPLGAGAGSAARMGSMPERRLELKTQEVQLLSESTPGSETFDCLELERVPEADGITARELLACCSPDEERNERNIQLESGLGRVFGLEALHFQTHWLEVLIRILPSKYMLKSRVKELVNFYYVQGFRPQATTPTRAPRPMTSTRHEISVHTLSGRVFPFELPAETTVSELKERLAVALGSGAAALSLTTESEGLRELDDGERLGSLGQTLSFTLVVKNVPPIDWTEPALWRHVGRMMKDGGLSPRGAQLYGSHTVAFPRPGGFWGFIRLGDDGRCGMRMMFHPTCGNSTPSGRYLLEYLGQIHERSTLAPDSLIFNFARMRLMPFSETPAWPLARLFFAVLLQGQIKKFLELIVLIARLRVILCLARSSHFFGFLFFPFVLIAQMLCRNDCGLGSRGSEPRKVLGWNEGSWLLGCSCDASGRTSLLSMGPVRAAEGLMSCFKAVRLLPTLPGLAFLATVVDPFVEALLWVQPAVVFLSDLIFSVGFAEGLAMIVRSVDRSAHHKLVWMSMNVGRMLREGPKSSREGPISLPDEPRQVDSPQPLPEWREDGTWNLFDG
eukprot:g29265.t1